MFGDMLRDNEEDEVLEITQEQVDATELSDIDVSEIVLEALLEECDSDEEKLAVLESATDLYLYGIISDMDIVTEQQKNIVRLNKQAKLNKEIASACIRLARKANDQHYIKYAKHRHIALQEREFIYEKWKSKATQVAKKSISNARKKASSMPKTNKSITDKIDNRLKKIDGDKLGKK